MSRTLFYRLTPDGAGIQAALKAGMLVAGQATGDAEVALDLETGQFELVEWLVGAVPEGTALSLELDLRTTDPKRALTTLAPLAGQCYLRQDPPPDWQDLVHDDLSWRRHEPGRIEVAFGLPVPPFPEAETRRILTERVTLAARSGLIDGVDFRVLASRFMAEFVEASSEPDPVAEGDLRFSGAAWCAGRSDGSLAPGAIALDLPEAVAERLGGLAAMFDEGAAVRVTATLGGGAGNPRPTELKALDLGEGTLRAAVGGLSGKDADELLNGLVSRLGGDTAGDRVAVSWQCAFKGAPADGAGVVLQAGDGDTPDLWLCLDDGGTNPDAVAARVTKAAGVTLATSKPEGGDSSG
jgi:hypothetical protein